MPGKDDPLIPFSLKFNAIPALTLAAHNERQKARSVAKAFARKQTLAAPHRCFSIPRFLLSLSLSLSLSLLFLSHWRVGTPCTSIFSRLFIVPSGLIARANEPCSSMTLLMLCRAGQVARERVISAYKRNRRLYMHYQIFCWIKYCCWNDFLL